MAKLHAQQTIHLLFVPYIMVPADMAEEDGCEAEAYSEYLKNEDGSLKTCTGAPNS